MLPGAAINQCAILFLVCDHLLRGVENDYRLDGRLQSESSQG